VNAIAEEVPFSCPDEVVTNKIFILSKRKKYATAQPNKREIPL
jgi:hypothetical protein